MLLLMLGNHPLALLKHSQRHAIHPERVQTGDAVGGAWAAGHGQGPEELLRDVDDGEHVAKL